MDLYLFNCILAILELNKSLTSISFFCDFTEGQLMETARSLVLNGYRSEIELEFGQSRSHDSKSDSKTRYESIVQGEVDKFKSELVTMIRSVYHVYQQYKREQFVAMHGAFCVSCV